MKVIEVVSVGGRFTEAEKAAQEAVSSIGLRARFLDPLPLGRSFFLPNGQIDGEALLSSLPGPSHDAFKRVYLLGEDATVSGLNFIFGLAEPGGGKCLVALPRLLLGDRSLFAERVRKEVLHELGHTFGLSHCRDPHCVMRFSNSLAEVDEKSGRFCSTCLLRMKALLGE